MCSSDLVVLGNIASICGTSSERFRERLVKEGVLAPEGHDYIFTRDHLFSSPKHGRSRRDWAQ